MDIGIPLSQFASQSILTTGFPVLDSALEGGFKPGCIYEIYGPPGSCKESLLKNLLGSSPSDKNFSDKDSQEKHLLIQTHKPIWANQPPSSSSSSSSSRLGKIHTTRITKFSHLIRFLQIHHNNAYTTIVIDGFAQLLIDHTNFSRRAAASASASATATNTTIDYTTKRLNLLLSILTKYATAHGTVVLLVNHTMVIQRELDYNAVTTDDDNNNNNTTTTTTTTTNNNNNNNNFLISNALKKGVLTSALEWSNALTGKDAIGLKLIKSRLGLYWHWSQGTRAARRRNLAAIVLPGTSICELDLGHPSNYTSNYELQHVSKHTVRTDSLLPCDVNKNADRNKDEDGPTTILDSQQ